MRFRSLIPLTAALILAAPLAAQEARDGAATDAPQVTVPFFGNQTCPLMGKKAKQTHFVEQDGERVYVCCLKCKRRAAADFEAAYAAAYPEDALVDMQNEKCPIMGEPIEKRTASSVFQGHKVWYCCKGCDRKFMKAPRRHLTLIKHPELKTLDNAKCLVKKDAEVAPDTFFIYKDVLIGASEPKAADLFAADPERFLAAAGVDLDALRGDGQKAREGDGGRDP